MDMKRFYKTVALTILLSLIIQIIPNMKVLVYAAPFQSPPSPTLKVEELTGGVLNIGYDEYDKYYVGLKWDAVFDAGTAGYLNLYLQEVPKGYRTVTPRTIKERGLTGTSNTHKVKDLKSGTIYYMDMTAYQIYFDSSGEIAYTSPESSPSNRVKVLTDIEIAAYSYGTNQIKIEWDDVWDTGGRIGYKLYISENEAFANTQPIYIGNEQIGEGKAVSVNEKTGKLEYIHTVRDPGRVYYIRIEPEISNDEIKRTKYTKTVQASSFILVKTSKMSSTNDGIVWKLEWSPVVAGLSDSNIKISYHIYRGIIGSSSLAQYMAAVDGREFFVTVPPGKDQYYFIIRAIVTRNGEDIYKGIRIESDQIILTEQEIPSRPTTPEIVDFFERAGGDRIISYDDELTPRSATILWRLPLKGNGEVDNDVTYDIWLVTDPDTLDNPSDNQKIMTDFKVGTNNYIKDGDSLIGYKYKIDGLNPNSTYYLKIVAKKKFLENVNGVLQSVTYYSDPAFKVIVTPIDGDINQPVVPARPPVKIKEYGQGKYSITENSVTIQIKNLWYEKFNFETNKWEYIRSEKLNENDVPPFDPKTTVVDDVYYRKVTYDSGVTLEVGCIEYVEGMDYEELKKLVPDKVTDFPVTPNDPNENPNFNPDRNYHNVDITLTGLEPNTTYVVWVRAVRRSVNLVSGPSDPLVFTTLPIIETPVEKPVVPYFNYSFAGDTYIDLGWDIVPGYSYYLKYGLEDNPNAASNQITITSQDLRINTYYRVEGLKQDTLYYFWIQAESFNADGISSKSDWSDSYSVRTLKFIPPDTPKGFGIKNTEDAITKNSITYEWMMEENMQYILEISKDIDYKDSTEYSVSNSSEYTVDGLLSNHRYYARLYAFDPVKNLRSQPTQSITVRTLRSDDDFDSDEDIEDVITGEFVEKGTKIVNDTWNIKITGVNADRFVQHVLTDNKLDYVLDVTNPPSACDVISIVISDKVFKALTLIGENLIIKTKKVNLIIRPGVLTTESSNPLVKKASGVDYEIAISFSKTGGIDVKNMTVKLETGNYKISAFEGANTIPLNQVLKPLQFVVAYNDENWYANGKTSGFVFDSATSTWTRASTSAVYNRDIGQGKLTFESIKSGETMVAQFGNDYFDDIYYHYYETVINNVASVHEIKSVSGRLFAPDLNATLGDSVKLIFDVLDYQYGNTYMEEAFKAGLINYNEIYSASRNCTVSKAYSMIVRLFELKTGTTLSSEKKSKFISSNGFTVIRNGKSVSEDSFITRGEIMYLIEKLLVFIGEID